MTAEEIKKLSPRYILTEEDEARIPSISELEKRYRNGKHYNDEIFSREELSILLKGRDAAYSMIRDLEMVDGKWDGDAQDEACAYVWGKCFRNREFQDVCLFHKHTDRYY